MIRVALPVLVALTAACSAPTRSAAVVSQPVALAPAPKPVEQPKAPTRPMGADAYDKGTEALARFMAAPDCNGADLRVVAEQVADLERTIALFDPSQTPSIRGQMLAYQDQARERHTSLAFALADGALKNGCLDAADQAYRRIISFYTGSAYSGIRDRAKLGVDDVRAGRGR